MGTSQPETKDTRIKVIESIAIPEETSAPIINRTNGKIEVIGEKGEVERVIVGIRYGLKIRDASVRIGNCVVDKGKTEVVHYSGNDNGYGETLHKALESAAQDHNLLKDEDGAVTFITEDIRGQVEGNI